MSTAGTTIPDALPLVVVGAQMRGLPLNGDREALGAVFLRACRTAPNYKIYELPDSEPPKPGLIRVDAGSGVSVDVEIWSWLCEKSTVHRQRRTCFSIKANAQPLAGFRVLQGASAGNHF